MNNVGLIMECNPFHGGHEYIIGQARRIAGEDGSVIAVISGNFTQRGIPAVAAKEVRVRRILEAGADLVLELPVRFAVSGAGYFAEGGVCLLARTGVVTDLVFGSESGDLAYLQRCARFLWNEPEDYRFLLRSALSEGLNYPAACTAAAAACEDKICLPDAPNDLLGAEYLKVLLSLRSGIRPHAVLRIDAPSASSLRADMMSRGEGLFPDDFSGMLLEKLLMIRQGTCRFACTDYADVSEDLANRIHHLLPQYRTWTQFCSLLKTRNITYTALSRAMTHMLLDVTKDIMPKTCMSGCGRQEVSPEGLIPYARVLGCRRERLFLLGTITGSGLPLVTSRADADRLLPAGTQARRLLDLDLRASEAWELAARMKAGSGHRETAEEAFPASPAVSEFARPLIIL